MLQEKHAKIAVFKTAIIIIAHRKRRNAELAWPLCNVYERMVAKVP